jgi:hypothetical protein
MSLAVKQLALTDMKSEEKSNRPKEYLSTIQETVPYFPERRLWVAVILAAITEYEDQLTHISKLWFADKKPLSHFFINSLRMIKHEVYHDWFRHVCDLADIDQSHIIRKIKNLDLEHKLSEIRFLEQDANVSRFKIIIKSKHKFNL